MAPSRPRSLSALTFGSGHRNISPGLPSPTFSDATHASAMNFGSNGPEKIITRANLKASLQAYEELVNSCAAYRAALITMSKATAGFADAMERCSGLKGPTYEAGTRLQAASGVHHLIGNLWHVLSDTLDKKFERPLRQHLEGYKAIVAERSQNYERALREKSQVIRDTEMRSMNKGRNLQSFRQALSVLQRQVDELDDLKASHYHEIIEHEAEVWNAVQSKVCVVVRSEMDVFDRFTSKASDPIIEPMLQAVPDPFDSYGPPQSEDQIFSILTPLSIMTSTTSSTASPLTGTPEHDPFDSLPSSAANKITAWLPSTNGDAAYNTASTDWATTPSPSATPPRSTSPPVKGVSPPNGVNRRHSVPVVLRKPESKLRSVLPVIEEAKPYEGEENILSTSPLPHVLTIIATPQPDTGPDSVHNGESLYDNTEGQLTPRHSTLFSPQFPPPPPPPLETPPNHDMERCEPDDQEPLPPIATLSFD